MTDAGSRNVKSARIWDGTWKDLAILGKDEGFAPSTLVGDAADLLAGYYRCARCGGTPVPVRFGDLSGRPLREWVAEAEKAVRYQKCKDHHPVLVGAEAVSQPPPASGTDSEAATKGGGAQERTEPPAPVPAQAPKAPRRRKEAPVLVAAGNGQPGTAVPFRAGPDVDCLHENFRGVKGVCPDCKQWVGGRK